MILREFFKRTLTEGGNLEIDGTQAQHIDLKVHNRAYITPILNSLLHSINNGFEQSAGGPLWSAKVLKSRKYLSGSSLHFFDTNIPDDEFERVKPKVGDIDTQVNKDAEPQLAQWLNNVKGQVVGNAKFLGYSRGNEQYSSLWELTDPPIKIQIDFEFVDYGEKDEPTDWSAFSHSSSWDDVSQGIKGVFHKWLIQGFTKLSTQDFLLRKMVGRGKARIEQDVPTTDNMFSFAVSSKEGGGLRPKYEPVADEKGRPLEIDGVPVMRALPASGYEKDLSTMFQNIFGQRIDRKTLNKMLPKTWSFTGLLELMNLILPPEEKEQVLDSFVDKLFAPGAQGLYKGDAQRDMSEKNAALNYALKVLKITAPKNLEQMRQDYVKNYKVTSEGPLGLDNPIEEAEGDNPQPAVVSQLRKGMPHLRDLKPADFLDLVDELRSEGGRFKLQNIPLNVKIDGFGGRFGKDAEGKPFMGTSNTPPRYEAGFVKHHQNKGTTDPDILGRAANFDKLFNEMMNAIKAVDSKIGPDALMNKQVSCEVLFLPFATQTTEGKLKFVGIEYDQLPKGVDLVLVPFRVVEADTGEESTDGDKIVSALTDLGQKGSVMFMSNRLTQKEGLDVTEIINPLENLEELKKIVSDTAGKRDRESLQLRREVIEKLKPVQIALEQAIDEDPNIVGKDNLGQDYEGIVINSRLGPIKVTSQKQKDIITAKNAAKKAAWQEQPRANNNKTAVVAIGSFVGHVGHEQLWDYTIKKAAQVGGDPYLFIGNAEGKDDPIPPAVKVQTWHKMYPQYAKNISTVQAGGSLIQKIKHELINPLPEKPPRYDNIIIMVGEDQAKMNIANALMKAVNKFKGYEHVKATLEATPRGTGMSFTRLRNILKDPKATPEQQYAVWAQGFDENKLGKAWILHLMDITRKGMGIQEPKQQPVQQTVPVAERRLFNTLVRPLVELSNEKLGQYKKAAGADASAADKAGNYERGDKRFKGIVKATVKQGDNDAKKQQGTAEGKEQFNYELAQKGFHFEQEIGGVTYKVYNKKGGSNNIKIDALDQKNQVIGHVSFSSHQYKDGLESLSTSVEPAWRGKGIATNMYAVMRMLGVNIHPASTQSDDGKAMWSKWNKQGDAQHIKSMNPKMAEGDSGAKYKVRSIGKDKNGDYYVSPNTGKKVYKKANVGDHETPSGEVKPKVAEAESNAMAQTTKRLTDPKDGATAKLRAAGDKRREEHLKGRDIAKRDDQQKEEKQRLDPKCWTGYKKQGTKMKGGVRVNNCVPVSEDVQNIMDVLINKIIMNEAISHNK